MNKANLLALWFFSIFQFVKDWFKLGGCILSNTSVTKGNDMRKLEFIIGWFCYYFRQLVGKRDVTFMGINLY